MPEQKYVLACDDDVGIVEVIRIVLEEKGYKVKVTTNSEEIFSLIKRKKPDLIILDLWMPGLRGEEVVKKLKGNKETATIPVIIISASRDTEKISQEAGVQTFLSKPFDLEVLEEAVDKVLRV